MVAGFLCALAMPAPSVAQAASPNSGIESQQLPQTPSALGPPAIVIPRLSRQPEISDFLTMKAAGEVASQMTRVSGFVQRDPHDGAQVSERTDAYLGYDEKNLYVVFVCFDQTGQVRAHEARREDVGDDDTVEVMLDTFHDRRRAYAFQINPLGVQWDAIWSEIPHEEVSGNFDTSFDTLWYSDGKVTPEGYVAWMAIPFKSLRFPADRGAVMGHHSLSRVLSARTRTPSGLRSRNASRGDSHRPRL